MAIDNTLQQISKTVDLIILRYLRKGAVKEFQPIISYQVKVGGKRVRPALTLLICRACGGKINDALLPAAMIELIHNYSLVMDDIIDHGELRRGLPTVRIKYGDAQALLAGMFHREILGEMAQDTSQPNEMHALLVNAIKQTIEGERMDILCEQTGRLDQYTITHRYTNVPPELYFRIIKKKTAELIKAACLAGAITARANKIHLKAAATYGEKVGLAFQVIDDFLDIFGEKTGKQRGKDIIEHKLNNAIIVYALPKLTLRQRSQFLKILRRSVIDAASLKEALEILESTNAKDKVIRLAKKLVKDAKKSLEVIPETSAKKSLEDLADFIITRIY